MPSRQQTVEYAVAVFEKALEAFGRYPSSSWLGIYQALLWYEPTGGKNSRALPHIIDSDKLRRPPSRGRTRADAPPTAWQKRAIAVEAYLAQQMRCDSSEVSQQVDRLLRRRVYRGLQRQNPLGIGFIGLMHHALLVFGNNKLTYETEQMADQLFPGIRFPGRSNAPSIDILVRKGQLPRAIVSVKWSLRHDRINDLTNECPTYKQAASWGRNKLDYVVVTNEYDPARLSKVLGDSCIDAVVHVHKPAIVDVAGLNGRLNKLLDLTDLFNLTYHL